MPFPLEAKLIPIIIAIIVILVVVIVVFMFSHSQSSSSQTLEQKLDILGQCGLVLSPPFTANDLLQSWDRAEYEKPGWDLVLLGLGMTEEEEPFRNHCQNLWHFDTECIEDHGDYKVIVERMAEMTQGSLPLQDIKDYVDIEEGKAWFSFKINGAETRIDCKVEDDWVDTDIFSKFVELLRKCDPNKVFIYYNLGGQDCMIGCVTKAQLNKLQGMGIKFEPLR